MKFRLIALTMPLILVLAMFSACGDAADSTFGTAQPQSPEEEMAEALQYLDSLESYDPSEVDQILKEYHRQALVAERDQRLKQLEDGEITVWSLFEDYAILGDSRVCGFMFMNVLDNSRILASYGETTKYIEDHIPELQKINPSYIFLCYGLNDMVQMGWETPEAFVADYRTYIRQLQQVQPQAKIFVNCLFPVYDPAFERWEKWRESPAYNEAIAQMAREEGCYFIENANLLATGNQLYNEDGIHFTVEFNEIWATNMITAVYNSELGLEERDGQTLIVEDEDSSTEESDSALP